MINHPFRREHTAYVTQPVGMVEQSLDNLRIGIGVDAHLRVDSDLTVYQRGAHGIRISLTAIRHDPDADPAVGPEVLSLSLSNATTLHELLGDALARAHRINHPHNNPTGAAATTTASDTNDSGDPPANVIHIPANQPAEDVTKQAAEEKEDPHQ